MMFQTDLIGRRVVFGGSSDEHLQGKEAVIVSANINGNSQIVYFAEFDGHLYMALLSAGANSPCKLLPKDK